MVYFTKRLSVILIFVCLSIGAQTIIVEYQQSFNTTSINLDQIYQLALTDSLSIYSELDKSEISSENEEVGNYNRKTFTIATQKKTKSNVYLNDKVDLYFQESFFGEALKVKEDVFEYNWQVIDSTKKIAKYTCKLATKKFRGRKYYVWFTDEIPTYFGPWKLFGVGGLILEARDEKNEFSLQALKINILDNEDEYQNKKIKALNAYFKNEKDVITVAELRKFVDEKNQIILNRIRQQLPRGASSPKLTSDCEECNESLENY